MQESQRIEFACPDCQRRLCAPAGNVGRSGKCPACGAPVRVPEGQPQAEERRGPPLSEVDFYSARNDAKHAHQVVVTLPMASEVSVVSHTFEPPTTAAGLAFDCGSRAVMLAQQDDDRHPSFFAKATGVVELLRGHPVKVALGFYRMTYGGLFEVFLEVDAPAVRTHAGHAYLGEYSCPLDSEDRELVEVQMSTRRLQLRFVAPGDHGPNSVHLAYATNLPLACGRQIKDEWRELVAYHDHLRARDHQRTINQFQRENPAEVEPVFPA